MNRDHVTNDFRTRRIRKSLIRPAIFWLSPLVILGLVLLWMLPSLLSVDSVLQWIVGRYTADAPALVSIRSVSAGWLSPIVLDGLEVHDLDGRPLLSVDYIETQRTLWQLLRDNENLGRIRLHVPRLHLRIEQHDSNFEQLARWWLGRRGSARSAPKIVVAANAGELEITDTRTERTWRLSEFEAQVASRPLSQRPLVWELEGLLGNVHHKPGHIEVKGLVYRTTDGANRSIGDVLVRADSLPLGITDALATRFATGVDLDGRLAGAFKLRWQLEEKQWSLHTRSAAASDLVVTAPQWLGEDTLDLKQVSLHGEIRQQGAHLSAHQLRLVADLGEVELEGGVQLAESSGGGVSGILTLVRTGDYRVTGRIDLAQLAQALPRTLHVRQGVVVDSGEVNLLLSSTTAQDHRQWRGTVQSTNLGARHAGRRIEWDAPIRVEFSAHQSDRGLVLDQLDCTSQFIHVSGRGSAIEGKLEADVDLDRFVRDVERLIDFGKVALAGKLQADLHWNRVSQDGLQADGQLTVDQFAVRALGWRLWGEDRLEASIKAEGRTDLRRWTRLDQAAVELKSGEDRLSLELLQPVDAPSFDQRWSVRCKASGDLTSWRPRLHAFVNFYGWDTQGRFRVAADADLGPERFALRATECEFADLQLKRGDVLIREPRVLVNTAGNWDRAQRRLEAPTTTLATSAISFRVNHLRVDAVKAGIAAQADLAFLADLDRLRQWRMISTSEANSKLSGMASGELQVSHRGGVSTAEGALVVENVAYAARRKDARPPGTRTVNASTSNEQLWQLLWSERQVAMKGKASFNHAQGALEFENLDVSPASEILQVKMQGSVGELSGRRRVDVSGELAYDWKRLAPLLRPYLGEDFRIEGRDQSEFLLKGPTSAGEEERWDVALPGEAAEPLIMDARDLVGQAELGWTAAFLYGVDIGPGQLRPRLANGQVTFDPIDFRLSKGRILAKPYIDLQRRPASLQLAPGVLLEDVSITPQMCHGWLKYVAPLVADATRAQGVFSLTVDQAVVPLTVPAESQAAGSLSIKHGQIGPGPLSQQFLVVAEHVRALIEKRPFRSDSSLLSDKWLVLPEQQVAVEIRNGRVFHRRLEVLSGDVLIRTYGSVGLDQTLALTAEVPIRDQWVQSDRLLSAVLRGRVIQVPIRGDFSRPQIDTGMLERLAGQILNDAASRMLQDEMNRGIQRLLGRP